MTDLTASITDIWGQRKKIDWVWALIPIIVAVIAILAPADLQGVVEKAVASFLHTLPFIIFAICATGYLRATGAEGVVAKAFTGSPVRMIVFASLVGGLAPFCSCEVIPFIAALLAMGAPLSAVMAFWLASPIMDPPMFAITTGALGWEFAMAKTVAAVGFGLLGGFGVLALSRTGLRAVFADPLRPDGIAAKTKGASCCGAPEPAPMVEDSCCATPQEAEQHFDQKPVWKFWTERDRVAVFRDTAVENGLFLGKWLALAYLLESIMIRWVPADWIAGYLGGDGVGTIFLASILGAPAYLNGYAAAPLAAGLIEQGMNPGAAMAFLLAGGVTSIPAAAAVWSLVKLRVFLGYLGFAILGSVIAGLTFGAIA
ncbi:MAG: permease [Pseudomonadota bacterium]